MRDLQEMISQKSAGEAARILMKTGGWMVWRPPVRLTPVEMWRDDVCCSNMDVSNALVCFFISENQLCDEQRWKDYRKMY